MKKKLKILLLSLAALFAVRIAAMAIAPVFEPSEARYAAISANMARTGNWLAPHFTYEGVYQPFEGKPPLVFQASGLCCKLLGVNEFAVRLAPFLSFVALLLILSRTVRRRANAASALLAVGICASSVALYATAGFCMTDGPLALCVSGALLLYWRLGSDRRSTGLCVAIAALLGCGMLVKGPVALALFGLPVVVDTILCKLQKPAGRRPILFDLKPSAVLVSLLVFLVITVPWFWAMESRNPGFLKYFFVNENLLRFLVHDYGDRYGAGRETFRGMAAVWTFVVALPWSLVALRVIWPVPGGRRAHLRDSFPLLAALVVTLFWCLTSRVPVAYLLPVAPLLAAHLAVYGRGLGVPRIVLWRLVPWAAAIASVVLTATLVTTRVTKPRKMPGRSAPRLVSDRKFSYEFYNGPWGRGAEDAK